MGEHSLHLPSTRMRDSYLRARSIDHDQQILECADLLSHPELIADEMLDAYAVVESFGESELDLVCNLTREAPAKEDAELLLDHFYVGREIGVAAAEEPDRDRGSDGNWEFRCLATDVRPVPELISTADGVRDGFDYIAERLDTPARPILGVVESMDDSSAYPLMLRLLSGLTELAPAKQLHFVNSDRLAGALAPDACFDLHMIVCDDGQLDDKVSTLRELSRDLAEMARKGMAQSAGLASRVGAIHCLRMNPTDFAGHLDEVWRL